MRTYDRETFLRARSAWYDAELIGWERIQAEAAKRGMIFPPNGTRWDSWDAPNPTQLAKVEQARQENEPALIAIIRRSSSWSQVVERVMALEDHTRELVKIRLDDDEWEAMAERKRRFGDPTSLRDIFRRLADSA